ncbi:MAG: hypothetical protein JWP97_1133 [Labilithrix sp.]|nr:hypothetical protein [Labilithrix sp.]
MPDWFHADGYRVARLVLQRGLGLVYLIAFVNVLLQFRPLLGERGLLPVPRFLERVPFRLAPSVFHLGYSDRRLMIVGGSGAALALLVVAGVPDRWPVALTIATWLALWALYQSIVNVGQRFYGFGWETLLLEAGFLAAFLGPAWSAVPAPILWGFRWLLFRLELGAGLIKIRGDQCWRDCTCLYYHHETQPMPNPLSWWFHALPKPLHRVEVVGSHVAQLLAPPLLFLPQPVAGAAAAFMAITQAWLVLSGNFSWLNIVTILLAASAMSDGFFAHASAAPLAVVGWHDGLVAAVAALVAVLSYRPARNLLSREQLMNASFDPLHLVNTYGAFGSVSKVRLEVAIEGTRDAEIGPETVWREYGFRGKPTDPMRRPRQWAPYHLRLDWMMWFAALSPMREIGWLDRLLVKLLEADRATLGLLAHDPFAGEPPRAIRAVRYRYRFTTWRERRATGAWWERTRREEVVPPMVLGDTSSGLSMAPLMRPGGAMLRTRP